MKKKLYILHQYGAPRHFESLFYMNNVIQQYEEIRSLEFNLVRQFGKGLIRRKFGYIKRAFQNTFGILNLLLSKNKEIIIAAAPYDKFIYLLYLLKLRHKIIYYSSWPHWDGKKYPMKIYTKHQFRMWEKFLKDIKAVGVTPNVADGLRKYTSNIKVIPHCVNEKVFYKKDSSSNGIVRILFVGRIVKEKGIHFILDAIEAFQDRKDIEWWFVGEGSMKHEILLKAQQFSNVKYWGKINDENQLASIYQQAQILLLPSVKSEKWEELFGIVLIEAMACGVVPISTASVGPKTIISDGDNGFLIEAESNSLISKINTLLTNSDLLDEMSKSASDTVDRNYTINKTALTWKEVCVL